MRSFFTTDPAWSAKFDEVWLWQDWPGRDGKADTGIDLVARDRFTGEHCAIQCKFYAPTITRSRRASSSRATLTPCSKPKSAT